MFSKYVGSFHSEYTLNELYNLIESLTFTHNNALLAKYYRFSIESVSFDVVATKIILQTYPKRQLNSFTPCITISIWESEGETSIIMEFEAKSSLRLFVLLYDLICIIFQLVAIIPRIIYKETLHFHHFIPICMITAEHVFFPPYLEASVKELWNELYIYLVGNNVSDIPKLIKQKATKFFLAD